MKKLLLIGILLIAFSGCTKEFLDAKPKMSIVVPTTLKDLRPLMDNSDYINRVAGIHAISSDDYFTTQSGWLAWGTTQERNAYLWNVEIFGTENSLDWSTQYTQIFYANVVLDGLKKITVKTPTEQIEWNSIKGLALFSRAFGYYHLAALFTKPYDANTVNTDLGLPLRLKSDVNDRPGRGTLKQVYDQMLVDIDEAVSLLPDKSPIKSEADKPAAYALQAWIYMAMENYDAALVASEKALSYNDKLLDFSTLVTTAARPFPVSLPVNNNNEVLFYASLNPLSFGTTQVAQTYIHPDILNSYHANDLRRALYFADKGAGLANFKGNYTGNVLLFGGLTTNDFYLIRAECYARKQNTAKALEVLNSLLLTRWKKGTFVPYTATSAEDALRKILQERRKELVCRGTRWMDLRRLNKDPRFSVTLERTLNNVTYKLPPNDPRYTLPIPNNELALNPMEQNIR